MRKYIVCMLLVLGIATPALTEASCGTSTSAANSCCSDAGDCCGCPCSGKTFFTSRPLYQSYRPELWTDFRNDRMVAAEDGVGGAWDFVGFGAGSMKDNELAAYFLPNCQQLLTVREDITGTSTQQLMAEHFNIFTNNGLTGTSGFVSTSSFNAKQNVVGFGFHYKQGFLYSHNNTKWWYLDISSSVQQVKNRIIINEVITNNGGGAATTVLPQAQASLTAAFDQAAWNYGKISSGCDMKKTGVADIELKIGRQCLWNDCCQLAGYVGVLIPTGNKPQGIQVFEPIVGYNHHFGIIFGTEGNIEFWTSRCENWHANLAFAAHSQYLLKNTQTRSFDLKGKPWSRYIELYANAAQAAQAAALIPTNAEEAAHLSTPGINVLTQAVHVNPGFQSNATSALVLTHDCGFTTELGYNLYCKEAECVTLACPWVTGPAIKDSAGEGNTNPVRNITGNNILESVAVSATPNTGANILANYNYSLIQQTDLDLNSASHPNVLINLVYFALGYAWDNKSHPVHINAGASYEFAGRDFAVMKRWAAWGKFGVAF